MSPALQIQLLGSFCLVRDQQPVSGLDSPRLQSLLAYLLLHRDTPQSRQYLAFLFWPDSNESQARNNLRQVLFLLRRALPNAEHFLRADMQTVQWLPDFPFTLDVADFQRAVEQAATLDSLQEAVNLYRGDLLPGCYDDWLMPERDRLRAEFCTALERLMVSLEKLGDYRAAVRYGERLLRADPLREETYRELIRLYGLSGDRAGTVRVYQVCAKILKRDLDVEPSPETRAVYEAAQKPEAPPEHLIFSLSQRRDNLPTYLTSFVGRDEELEQLRQMLSPQGGAFGTRLLTLTGPGGCGKTRLAVQVAGSLVDGFAGGVWFVDVATLTDPALIPHAIASALSIPEQPGREPLHTIVGHLQSEETLLTLDNCEYHVSVCAQLVESLLSTCSRLRILTTSRERLNIAGERVWPVAPLPVSDAHATSPGALTGSAAIRLFIERASSVAPAFTLGPENAAHIVQICQRLDGLPLAIELAAARVALLAPAQIAARLDNALQLLAQASPSMPARHRTLRATMDWSHELLSKDERTLFRRLSVFAGSFTLEAVEAACSDRERPDALPVTNILGLLSRLVDKSLVVLSDWRRIDQFRYRLLEPTWQYASEKLLASGEGERVRLSHLRFFLNLAEEAEPHFSDTDQVVWFDRLMVEHDNLMAALDWALQHNELDAALRMTGALWYFWLARGYYAAGVRRLMQAISLTQMAAPSTARAKALWAAGAICLWSESDCSRARPFLEEAVAISRELRAERILAGSLGTLGATALGQEDHVAARAYLKESLALLRDSDDRHAAGWSLSYLGDLSLAEGEVEGAQGLYAASLEHFRAIGDTNSAGYPVRRLGVVALRRGDDQRASELFKESLALNREVCYPKGIAACLGALAEVALRRRQLVRAARLFGAAEALLDGGGGRLFPTDQAEQNRSIAALRTRLAEAVRGAAWAEGRAMPEGEATEYAMSA
jgi:predicted ATPase/DNA-binding SARP family transcriptional activator